MHLKCFLLSALLVTGSFHRAIADGGRLRFSKAAGPFLVTLFTAPEPLTPGPADFSVMVQDAQNGEILSDAQVTVDMIPQNDPEHALHAVASRGIATNRLLQAAEFILPASGACSLHFEVAQGARTAVLDLPIDIESGSRKAPLVWSFAGLPLLAILLFILHQRQRAVLAHRVSERNSA